MVSPVLAFVSLLVLSTDPIALTLQWNAPTGCPTREAVISRIAPLPDGQPIDVRADVTQAEAQWTLALTFITPHEAERTLTFATCDEAADATAFFVRLAREQPPAPPPSSWPPLTGFLGIHGDLHSLSLPTATWGAGLTGWVIASGWTARLSLSTFAPTTVIGGPTTESQVQFHRALSARLALGRDLTLGPLTLTPALLGELDWWRLTGQGVSEPHTSSTARFAVGALLALGINVWHSLRAFVEPAITANLTRPQAQFDGAAIFTTGPVELSVRVGIGWGW